MPAPSIPATLVAFAETFSLSGSTIQINQSSEFDIKLSSGFVAGWTLATPTTGSTFEPSIISSFGAYLNSSSNGALWLHCVGAALDTEVSLWTASWQPIPMIHTYVPSVGSIVGNIESCQPLSSPATIKMNTVIATWFIANFVQEVG